MLAAQILDVALFGAARRYGSLGFHATIDLRRSFSREQLERAVRATIEDFPVLGCRYEPRFWRDQWVRAAEPVSEMVHINATDEDIETQTRAWVDRPLDVVRSRPLRIVSCQRPAGSRLVISIAHTAVDGGGAMAIAQVLGSHLYGVRPPYPVEKRRDIGPAFERLRWYHLPVLAADIAKTLAQPLEMARVPPRERGFGSAGPGTDGAGKPYWRQLVVTAEQLGRFKKRCKAQGASVNDGLVAALARVAASRSSRGPVAVLYTMDLRRYLKRPRLIATNFSAMLTAFVPRRKLGSLDTTLTAVSKVTTGHRKRFDGLAMVLTGAAMLASAPHRLAHWIVRGASQIVVELPSSRALMLSNVGRLDEGLAAFGQDIEDLAIIGPDMKNVAVPTVVAFGFRGQLRLLLYGAPGITRETVDHYAEEILQALELSG